VNFVKQEEIALLHAEGFGVWKSLAGSESAIDDLAGVAAQRSNTRG
jgi:hypothetical protein